MPYALTLPGSNPLSPKSDRPLISPYSFPVGSHIKVMRTKGNDHQLKMLSFVKQILLVCTQGNVWRTVWRICILMLRCKG